MEDKNIIADSSAEWKDLGNGVKRKVMFYDEAMVLVKFQFEKGAVGALHIHPHRQMSYLPKGVFEFMLSGPRKKIKDGDIYNVPSQAEHRIVCLESGMLVDVFNPIREEIL
jgi:quercetin dioxygenase-like cupin family protein